MADELKTPDEWLETDEFKGYVIFDPDGWDGNNFEKSWNEKITRDEFKERLYKSTLMCRFRDTTFTKEQDGTTTSD